MKPEPVIDFESYYDKKGISVTELGIPNYIATTDAYILSVARGDEGWCGEIKDFAHHCPEGLKPDPGEQVWAANSNFDEAWWNKYFTPLARPWKCILDRARVAQLPSTLADLARVVLGKAVDKSVRDEMCGKRWEDLSSIEKDLVEEYCLHDSLSEAAILKVLPEMTPFEERLAAQTRSLNRKGVCINETEVHRAKQTLETACHAAYLAIPWSDYAKPLSYPEFCKWCLKKGVVAPASTSKGDRECEGWMKAHPECARVLLATREFRRAHTLLEKVKTLHARLVNGVLPLELIYCGAAHTRRWSCRGFNIQNLDRDEVPFEVSGLSGENSKVWTRKFIVPRPGKVFIILDLAQIEPRCLWYIVSDTRMLDMVRGGFGIYEAHARATMGWTGGNLKKEHSRLYQLAKARVLGLGYGCGPEKFQSVAKTKADLDLSLEQCERVVRDFRYSNPRIIQFWDDCDQLIAAAAKDTAHQRVLEMGLYTGETLKHWHVLRTLGRYQSYTVKGDPKEMEHHFWGGVLTENIVQRTARDILGVGLLRLEDAGLNPVFHAHDEVILEVDAGNAREALQEAQLILSTAPEWAPDLPLGVEGGIHHHYVK